MRLITILFAVVIVAGARAEPPATITGGADASGHQYTWTVANHGESPIAFVEFPHYHAALFFAPDGWHTECTFLVNVGVEDSPGICRAWVDSPMDGIGRRQSAEFAMQIGTQNTRRGYGVVVLKTGVGEQIAVGGVELPQPATVSDRYVSLIALGTLFAVLVAARAVRRSTKTRANACSAASSPSDAR